MIRAALVISALLASIYAANAINFGHQGASFGKLGAAPKKGTGGGGGGGNALLLEDGSSILLLEDGTSFLCLEGGC